jgi:hypothetical protein
MIPQFPKFAKVSLENQASIEAYTHKFKPYSDFNFASLWSWDSTDERMVSILNENLVVKFTDYATNKPFYSFLGTNSVTETATSLINFSDDEGMAPVLTLIPEESVSGINSETFIIEEDKDNFDYIFSISDLAHLQGAKYKTKRHLSKNFERNIGSENIDFKVVNSDDSTIKAEIESVLRCWENNKTAKGKVYDLDNEEDAINRLLTAKSYKQLLISRLYVSGKVVGFSIDELLPDKFVMSHFFKANNTFKGVFEFLNERVSEELLNRGYLYWNWEQDLGIESLHVSKVSYRPVDFIKKYKVSKKA